MTGTVEDVRPFLAEAAVMIVPLRVGGGTRLKILEWLKNPGDHFPPHASGLSFDHGVCVAYIQAKAGISQSATSQYMSILHQAGFVLPRSSRYSASIGSYNDATVS